MARDIPNLNEFRKAAGNYLVATADGGALKTDIVLDVHYQDYEACLLNLYGAWEDLMDRLETQRHVPIDTVPHFLETDKLMHSQIDRFHEALCAMKRFIEEGKLYPQDEGAAMTRLHASQLDRVIAYTDWYRKGADPKEKPQEKMMN
jgi:hypothetical protein